jgi:mono/diheme cytochrome c family protein
MKVRDATVAPFIAAAIAAATLGSTFALAAYMQSSTIATAHSHSPASGGDTPLVAAGHKLFLLNCAHCHADDATGDEGPDLHGLRKTDQRLRLLITNGIKGEMPRFGEKLATADLDALIAFLDSMR